MGIVTKLIKYGLVFALGYYAGGGCDVQKFSKLEQEVVKYEQNIDEKYGSRLVSSKLGAGY
ncbi:MAG: hypothetical protein Q8N77_04465 [Nanoarchaeota archaeon]|nr:hypothetical protein [Nanoarchaeota archaeon]